MFFAGVNRVHAYLPRDFQSLRGVFVEEVNSSKEHPLVSPHQTLRQDSLPERILTEGVAGDKRGTGRALYSDRVPLSGIKDPAFP